MFYLDFLSFYLFLFQAFIQNTTLHVSVMTSQAPLGWDTFSDGPSF